MQVVLKDKIINMGLFDTVRKNSDLEGDNETFEIQFARDEGEIRVAFDSEAERDSEWERITNAVNEWYS